MAKQPGSANLTKRIPRLCHTTTRGLGWHVNYRDPETSVAKKHRFDVQTEAETKVAYTKWLARHLAGETGADPDEKTRPRRPADSGAAAAPGSLVEVASGLIRLMEASVRDEGAPRARGTVARPVFVDRQKHIKDFDVARDAGRPRSDHAERRHQLLQTLWIHATGGGRTL